MDAAPSAGVLAEPPLSRFRTRLAAADPFLLAALALLALGAAVATPLELVDDSWLTLAAGREVARHGLPQVDALTVLAHGRRWIDQQWLAQLGLYGLWQGGGLRAALAAGALSVEAALAVGVVAARRAGAAPAACAAGALLAVLAAPWMFQLRAQTFVLPLYAVLYALLAADERRRSSRVFAVLPLLVLWANLHGSVLLAGALVGLYGCLELVRGRRRGAALVLGAPAAVLCTPYGLAIAGYYRSILVGNDFSRYVLEWRPTHLEPLTAAFFGLAALVAVRAGRHRARLTRFELLALPLLGALALDARRNIVWFALAALVSLPRLLAVDGARREGPRRLYTSVAAVALAAAAAVLLAGPSPRLPVRVGDAVAALDPTLRVFPVGPYGDWLLWSYPQLSGRVAWDLRDELLRPGEIEQLAYASVNLDVPIARGYRVFVLDRVDAARARRWLLGARHGRVLARDGRLEAILLPRA